MIAPHRAHHEPPISSFVLTRRLAIPRLQPVIEERDATRSAVATNRRFYDALWSASRVTLPQRFNTWPLLSSLAATARSRLEIGPGLRPRLPIAGTCVVDVSRHALSPLVAR